MTACAGGVRRDAADAPAAWSSNNRAEQAALGFRTIPGTDQSKSSIAVPILGSDRVLGSIVIEDYERENAFGEAEVRLLTTVAASMGVALENARLFDETQRLLKETEQRNAELAIINSVQEGLAAELDFQAIFDLVGDKIREIFDTATSASRWYDRATRLMHCPYYLRAWRAASDRLRRRGDGFAADILEHARSAGDQREHGSARREVRASTLYRDTERSQSGRRASRSWGATRCVG